jgi:3-hydroxy acid dehydrogenase/malonic semialdehyde reductase
LPKASLRVTSSQAAFSVVDEAFETTRQKEKSMEKKTEASTSMALITGASGGIGEATAIKLAETGAGLILAARRSDRLTAVAKRCREAGAREVFIHELDVSDLKSVEAFFKSVDLAGPLARLNILVNNAGLAKGVAGLDEGSISDWQLMVDTNVMGLLYVTRFALPVIKKQRGHIVNIGSVAGRWTYPGGGVYCASKAAVRALTEGLRMDLQGSRVRVTNIEPGMVETDFSKVRFGSEELANKVYANFTALSAADVAECITWSLSRPAHVNIQEMIVFPVDQAGVQQIYRETPKT